MEGITLGNPAALWGLLLLALPLYAHFSKLLRPQKTVFPDLRLLRQVWEAQSRKSQPNQRLLLLIRLVSILLAVLLFAQVRFGTAEPSAQWVWYLDASASMEMPYDETQSRFDAARKEVKSVLEESPADQWIEIKSEALPLGSSTRTAEEWLKTLDSLRPTAGSGQGAALFESAQWAVTDGQWNSEDLSNTGKSITLLQGEALNHSWPDSAWVVRNPKGENRWTGFVRFPAQESPKGSQKLSWWTGGKQVQWTLYQAVPNKGQTVASEFTLDPGANGCRLELRFSHGGQRSFWLEPRKEKNIVYLGPAGGYSTEWFPSPKPYLAVRKNQWSASDLDPNQTALLVVSDWDERSASEKASLRLAARQGIAVLGTNRGNPTPKNTPEVFDEIDQRNEFYSSIIVRMPTALEGVKIPSSGLPDSLSNAAFLPLLSNPQRRVALSMHQNLPLFWWAAGWNDATGGNLPATPLLYAWIRRMAEWPNRQVHHATTANAWAQLSFSGGQMVQNGHILASGDGGTRLPAVHPGWIAHVKSTGDTLAVYAVHPPRTEHAAWNLYQKNDWKGWKTGPPEPLQTSKSSLPPSYWLALLALVLVVTESYFARKSLPLNP
jgi:hypothetical protein